MSDNLKRSVSPKAAKIIPKETQQHLFNILAEQNKKRPLERYLQSFLLDRITENRKVFQRVTFWVETSPATLTYTFEVTRPVTASVYVLLNENEWLLISHEELEEDF